jgi:hypothetical protein
MNQYQGNQYQGLAEYSQIANAASPGRLGGTAGQYKECCR